MEIKYRSINDNTNEILNPEMLNHPDVRELQRELDNYIRGGIDTLILNDNKTKLSVSSRVNTTLRDININGRTLYNLLGRYGNAIYKMPMKYIYGGTINYTGTDFLYTVTEDTNLVETQKVMFPNIRLTTNKYYLLIGEVLDGGTVNGIKIKPTGLGISEVYTNSTSLHTNTWEVSYSAFKCSDESASYNMIVEFDNAKKNYTSKFRDIRLYEITREEYLHISQKSKDYINWDLADKYPYTEGIVGITNPYIENKQNLAEGRAFVKLRVDYDKLDNTSQDYLSTSYIKRVYKGEVYNAILDITKDISGDKYEFMDKLNIQLYTYNEGGAYLNHNLDLVEGIAYKGVKLVSSAIGRLICKIIISSDIDSSSEREEIYNIVEEKINSGLWNVVITQSDEPILYYRCVNSCMSFPTTLYDGELLYRTSDGKMMKTTKYIKKILQFVDDEFRIENIRLIDKNKVKFFLYSKNASNMKPILLCRLFKLIDISEIGEVTINYKDLGLNPGEDYTITTSDIIMYFNNMILSNINVNGFYNGGDKYYAYEYDGSNYIDPKDGRPLLTKDINGNPIIFDYPYFDMSDTTEKSSIMNLANIQLPYIIYELNNPIQEEIKPIGNIELLSNINNIVVSSGYMVEDIILENIYNPSNKYKETYGITNNNTYRIGYINKINNGIKFWESNDNVKITNGITDGRIFKDNLINKNIQTVEYLMYYADTVTSYNYTITFNNTLLASNMSYINTNNNLSIILSETNLLNNSNFKLPISTLGKFRENYTYNANNHSTIDYILDRWFAPIVDNDITMKFSYNDGLYMQSVTTDNTKEYVPCMICQAFDFSDIISSQLLNYTFYATIMIKNCTGDVKFKVLTTNSISTNVSDMDMLNEYKLQKGINKIAFNIPRFMKKYIIILIETKDVNSEVNISWINLNTDNYLEKHVDSDLFTTSFMQEVRGKLVCTRIYNNKMYFDITPYIKDIKNSNVKLIVPDLNGNISIYPSYNPSNYVLNITTFNGVVLEDNSIVIPIPSGYGWISNKDTIVLSIPTVKVKGEYGFVLNGELY